jgi:hypothetical protein
MVRVQRPRARVRAFATKDLPKVEMPTAFSGLLRPGLEPAPRRPAPGPKARPGPGREGPLTGARQGQSGAFAVRAKPLRLG